MVRTVIAVAIGVVLVKVLCATVAVMVKPSGKFANALLAA